MQSRAMLSAHAVAMFSRVPKPSLAARKKEEKHRK
jgi:hypothetical protein